VSIDLFHIWLQQTGIFIDVAAYDGLGTGFNITADLPERFQGIHVAEARFGPFGVPLMLGRSFEFALVAQILTAEAFPALCLPTTRASKLDPMQARPIE
jgi:hypothetical protein